MGALVANKGRPVHERGVAEVPGLYFLGMSWSSRRAPAFIWGVWHDAGYLAERIAAYDGTAPANRMAL